MTMMKMPRESELTPLERGLITQCQKLMQSVEMLTHSSKQNAQRQKKENQQLLELLLEQEKRVNALCNDMSELEKKLRVQ